MRAAFLATNQMHRARIRSPNTFHIDSIVTTPSIKRGTIEKRFPTIALLGRAKGVIRQRSIGASTQKESSRH
jgi:hypothetical protein